MVYKAPCKYFSICGGCTLQDMEQHGAYKFSLLENALAKLDSSFILHQLIQVPIRSRRRASFKLENNRLSFNKLRSHEKVAIEECLLLEDKLNNLILPINQLLKKLPGKVDGLNMLSSDTGIELLFLSKKPNNLENSQLLAKFASDHKVARIVWENNIVIQLQPVQLKFAEIKVDLPINSFLQVSKESSEIMSKIILKHLVKEKQILELYCGCGSFTIPMLEKKTSIYAVEGAHEAVEALNKTAKDNLLKIKAIKRDLYQNPLQVNELNEFSQVVINPPRNGAGPQIKQMAMANKVQRIIMISCSVENFIRDARSLIVGGFKLVEVYPIDQFLYSEHLELVAIFLRSS